MSAEATVLHPQGPEWRLAQGSMTTCRMLTKRRACREPAVLELNRRRTWTTGVRASWWGYCLDHAYGRVILDGEIYFAMLQDASVLVGAA